MLCAGVVGLGTLGVANAPAQAAPADPAVLGTSADTAAASCWEIKQTRPSAGDGAYWLWTPRLAQPQEFYCDMTTNGGGWVLVGKGRSGWDEDPAGQGAAANLTTPDLAPMGHTTTQLSSETVDGLLNGSRVDSLSDGIRLRRAVNTAGTQWQESRMKLARRDRWTWTFGAEHPLASWTVDTRSGTGGTTQSFGADTSYNRVATVPTSAQGYRLGFAYGSRVAGSSASGSYLWSATEGAGGALPFTQVYLRPTTTSTWSSVPDSGTQGLTRPGVVKSRALDSSWGVSGLAGSTAVEGSVEVQAFTQSGSTMYVGGNFARVQRDGDGHGAVEQPFLAGFDVATGELVQTFRPQLDEQVKALRTLPNGTVVAGGLFTRVNGERSPSLVALDPVTGATVPGWRVTVENRSSSGAAPIVQALDVQDGWLYVGGRLTHLTGPNGRTVQAKNLGRVEVADGDAGTNWNPRLNGTVNDVDASADGSRVYAAGYFGTAGGIAARRAAVLSTGAGAPLAVRFTPTWSASRDYQRAVREVGNRVYYGGSEHSLFGFEPGSMNRVSGSIMKKHGDIQAIDVDPATGVLYAGCHCDGYSYENAFTWPSLSAGWTQADAMQWVAAWDPATGKRIPDFLPAMKMRLGSGVWAIEPDSRGNLWVGGDIVSATTKSGARQWAGGFVRFDPSDVTAPATPSNVAVTAQDDTSATLSWSTVADAGGGVRYQVLRDDRVIAFTTGNTSSITVPKGGDNRFFVRATDAAGNISASSPVVRP